MDELSMSIECDCYKFLTLNLFYFEKNYASIGRDI